MPRQLSQSLVQLDDDAERVVARGREAWKQLRSDETFEKWILIGRAIDIGRKETMRALHTNRPAGAQWSRVFGAWLEEQGFAEIDKGARSRLQDCLDHLPEIEAWRNTLGLTQRLQLNHPNAVWRRFQATRQHPSPDDKGGPGSSGRSGLREENMRLQSELDAARREMERMRHELDQGNLWDWQDTPEDIAEQMLLSHPTKAKSVAAAILAKSKSTAPKPREKRRADPDAKLARHLWPTPNKPR